MPNISSDATSGISPTNASPATGGDRSPWQQLTESIKADLTARYNEYEPSFYCDSEVYAYRRNLQQRIASKFPTAGLFITAAVIGAIVVGNAHHGRYAHSPVIWIYIALTLPVAVGLLWIQTKLRRQVRLHIGSSSYNLLSKAYRALDEIKASAERGHDGAEAMLSAVEDMMPGFEELLQEQTALGTASYEARANSLITGSYGHALKPRLEDVNEQLFTITAEMLAAARIAFATRPNLLAVIAAPAAMTTDAPVTALTDEHQQALAGARVRLASAAATAAAH